MKRRYIVTIMVPFEVDVYAESYVIADEIAHQIIEDGEVQGYGTPGPAHVTHIEDPAAKPRSSILGPFLSHGYEANPFD